MLPFTHDEFLGVFAAYNAAVWPAQVVAYLLGLGACVALARGTARAGSVVAFVLGLGWLWTGLAYHLLHFARINPAAYLFGALFIAQGAFLLLATGRRQLAFAGRSRLRSAAGWGLIAYSMVAYPLIGMAAGAAWPRLPMFGITPCPLTLFTFGALMLASTRVPWWLLAVPAAWTLVGGSAAFLLHVPQDWPLLAPARAPAAIVRDRR